MSLVFPNVTQAGLFAFNIILSILCVIATVLRFIATIRSGRKIDLENWCALLALLSFLSYTVLGSVGMLSSLCFGLKTHSLGAWELLLLSSI
jgi:hypothetical protein